MFILPIFYLLIVSKFLNLARRFLWVLKSFCKVLLANLLALNLQIIAKISFQNTCNSIVLMGTSKDTILFPICLSQSDAQQLEMAKITKHGGGIGAPTREERMKEAANLHIKTGNIQRYCELMVELGQVGNVIEERGVGGEGHGPQL